MLYFWYLKYIYWKYLFYLSLVLEYFHNRVRHMVITKCFRLKLLCAWMCLNSMLYNWQTILTIAYKKQISCNSHLRLYDYFHVLLVLLYRWNLTIHIVKHMKHLSPHNINCSNVFNSNKITWTYSINIKWTVDSLQQFLSCYTNHWH